MCVIEAAVGADEYIVANVDVVAILATERRFDDNVPPTWSMRGGVDETGAMAPLACSKSLFIEDCFEETGAFLGAYAVTKVCGIVEADLSDATALTVFCRSWYVGIIVVSL